MSVENRWRKQKTKKIQQTLHTCVITPVNELVSSLPEIMRTLKVGPNFVLLGDHGEDVDWDRYARRIDSCWGSRTAARALTVPSSIGIGITIATAVSRRLGRVGPHRAYGPWRRWCGRQRRWCALTLRLAFSWCQHHRHSRSLPKTKISLLQALNDKKNNKKIQYSKFYKKIIYLSRIKKISNSLFKLSYLTLVYVIQL